jgi:anaerobic selenocysteine-containing dehydrogenase
LKRVGGRGEGKWKQISWDEALDETASRLTEIRRKYGAEAVAFNIGFVGVLGGLDCDFNKFQSMFGSPNRLVSMYVCNMPAHMAGIFTNGFSLVLGIDFRNSKCIVLWGLDVDVAGRGLYRANVMEARRNGARLIVVDPRQTPLAKQADVWLRVRPGTDCALALGMINVLINEGLYDREFVEQWSVGFDKLSEHVQQYTPEKVAEITWVPAEAIKEAARLYARNRPACIGQGGGGICHNINAFQTNRAVAMLASLTNNLDVRGGNVNFLPLLRGKSVMAAEYDATYGALSEEQVKKRLGADTFRLLAHEGFNMTHPSALWRAITEGKPYPARAMVAVASNYVAAVENAKQVREVVMKLDFIVASDLFMTPSCDIADIVLPAAHFTERDEIVDCYTQDYIFCHQKVVEPPGGCWEDKKILIELAKKLGMKGYWDSVGEALDSRLERFGITFEQFKEKGLVQEPVKLKKHEKFGGFKTGSKKIDFYSETLEKMGYDPIPVHIEPPESPVSTPELAKKYPLVLTTGTKLNAYFHSCYRNVLSLHKLAPEPLIDIHPDTAKGLGIKDGDWVEIETRRGSIKHKARFNQGLDPRVVTAPHGWWYGYKDGWKEVNINVLTEGDHYDPVVGSVPLKGLLCRVKKAETAPALS